MSKTVHMYRLEEQHGGKDIRAIIREAVIRHGSVAEAAAEFGLSPKALYNWIDRLGGDIRTSADVNFPEAVPV
jgi:transposase-like protein